MYDTRSKSYQLKYAVGIAGPNSLPALQEIELLSRGVLLRRSDNLSPMVYSLFAQVDFIHLFIRIKSIPRFAQHSLNEFGPNLAMSCDELEADNRKCIIKIIINIFFDNKLKLAGDSKKNKTVAGFNKCQHSYEQKATFKLSTMYNYNVNVLGNFSYLFLIW